MENALELDCIDGNEPPNGEPSVVYEPGEPEGAQTENTNGKSNKLKFSKILSY